jgi:hypothetical protein
MFVLVDRDGGRKTSPDGVAWSEYQKPGLTGVGALAYGNEAFIAGGYGIGIHRSADGTTWSKVHSIDSRDLLYANGLFVSCGYDGAVATSADGASWMDRTSHTSSHLCALAYGNGIYVAVGNKGAVTTSRDGVTWTAGAASTTENDHLRGVAYGKGLFVMVSGEGLMHGSTDGRAWTRLGCQPTPLQIGYGSHHVAYAEAHETFVVVGDDGKIFTMLYVLCVCVCSLLCFLFVYLV